MEADGPVGSQTHVWVSLTQESSPHPKTCTQRNPLQETGVLHGH